MGVTRGLWTSWCFVIIKTDRIHAHYAQFSNKMPTGAEYLSELLFIVCRKAFGKKPEGEDAHSAGAVLRREYEKLGPITYVFLSSHYVWCFISVALLQLLCCFCCCSSCRD